MPQVLHFRRTPLAYAPDALSDCINKYGRGWESRVTTDPNEIPTDHVEGLVVHFHNTWVPTRCAKLVQYHSEPKNPNLWHYKDPKYASDPNLPATKLVIAQYHATLPEYSECQVVRNVIDIWNPLLQPIPRNRLKIVFSPSVLYKVNEYYDKAAPEVIEILERLQKRFPGLEVDVIHKVPLEECLRRKQSGVIALDDVRSGSYHRSSLEALAQGMPVISWLKPEVMELLENVSHSPLCPITSIHLESLEWALSQYLEKYAVDELVEMGLKRRKWMELCWNPQDIVREYTDIYERVLSQ